ncbi:hypothetical protein Pan153_09870 [Gimesia panareensis]|uniref:Knr4/Smi1-like domain-containing protein n=1 Tax=Gimesia panareensis TaxID=2527978 RepID=A0A518FJB4_9PLAN|nr:hypothetical protein [Gimesia panareensis]QDV16360.1 hypothetical protein Pan153_09870 [Gimesia panareensis]
MFDHPQNPTHLLDSLINFVDDWQGIRSWYGVSEEKLNAVPLPQPLARLYGALGNMPGFDGRPFPFWHQDYLLPFELTRTEQGRLLFALENQGCWSALTEPTGDDPPVWIIAEPDEPVLKHPSLANFLVTLCLQELTLGAPCLYSQDGIKTTLDQAGFRVNPLWLHGLYPCLDQLLETQFYLVEGHALVYQDNWIGFASLEAAEPFAELLTEANRMHPPQTASMAEHLAQPDVSPMVKQIHSDQFKRVARDYQQQADSLQAKADECRRAAQRALE